MNNSLAQRIQVIEDIEEIRRLKWRYCDWSDRGWPSAGTDYDAWAGLFTEDAVYDTGGVTPTHGSRASLDAWNRQLGEKAFSFHLVGNGAIDVDGDLATGRWHVLTPVTDPSTGRALWSAGVFEDRLRRTPAGWRIARLKFRPAFVAEFDGPGWVTKS
jgi:hypothetical protein